VLGDIFVDNESPMMTLPISRSVGPLNVTCLDKGKFREMIDCYKDKKGKVNNTYAKGFALCKIVSNIQKDLTSSHNRDFG
jgi:hypothetical protein